MAADIIDSDKSLDFWLGKPVPRYTSYPPAPAFHTGVGGDDYASSLLKLGAGHTLSLYVHIPFCNELCLYCGCNMTVTRRADRIWAYVDRLVEDIQATARNVRGPCVTSLHFGGGTPNALPADAMRRVFTALRDAFDFAPGAEIAMEIDPRQSHEGQSAVLAECGVTRVSLGVQDFNPRVQELVHRIQPYEFVERTCNDLRAHGISAINFDLMYGLPLQTVASVEETVRLVCGLRPSRVALFSYAHVPQMKKHQRVLEGSGIPDAYDRLAMDRAAHAALMREGYREIGMDHFALPDDPMYIASEQGELHRNFQGYTTDAADALLGFGASSISSTPDGFFQNEREILAYQTMIGEGRMPVMRGIMTSPDDRFRAAIIERLMCTMACDVAAFMRAHGIEESSMAETFTALEAMRDAGLISWDGRTVGLLSPHRMAIRVVCHAFDQYAPA
jgi:oxygen-independent coproporphyrinogen-3 oxidase